MFIHTGVWFTSLESEMFCKVFNYVFEHHFSIGLIRYEIGIRSKFYVVFKMFDSRWVIALSTAWVPGPTKPWEEGSGSNGGLAGPRLAEFGASPVSARRRLFVWLAPHVRAFNDCMTMQWPFDVNETTRLHCGFIDPKVPR